MYTIAKQFTFSASHILAGLPEGHPCGRLHGHNYTVEIILAGKVLDATGFVVDYGKLRSFQDYLDQKLDHRHLNDVLGFQPSAENIARHLYEHAVSLGFPVAAVRVSETPKTWAEYRYDCLGEMSED